MRARVVSASAAARRCGSGGESTVARLLMLIRLDPSHADTGPTAALMWYPIRRSRGP
jgi:hypothetical protein